MLRPEQESRLGKTDPWPSRGQAFAPLDGVCGPENFGSVEATVACLEATGMRHWEALGNASILWGPRAATLAFQAEIQTGVETPDAVKFLDELAGAAPELANTLLLGWLHGWYIRGDLWLSGLPWVQGLPERLILDGDLCLVGCNALACLGINMRIGGSFGLFGCRSLPQLPTGLTVGGDLDVRACERISRLPDDLKVQGNILGWPNLNVPKGVVVGGVIRLA